MIEERRNIVIDLMRGFAMLMVIFAHAMQRSMEGVSDYGNSIIWTLIYDWHMPLFFIVSGFLVAKSKSINSISFLKNKFFRLIYVWFVWRWLEWLFMRFEFSGLLPFNSYVPKNFLGNLKHLITSPFQPLWFLVDLFLFFVLLWITKKLSFNNNKIWYILFSIAVLSLVVLSRVYIYIYP